MIEFIEDTHTYLDNGVIVPSVSELIKFKFPDSYCNVPERILRKKADYGSKVHQMIESFIKGEITMEEIQKKRIDPDIKIAVEQFEILRKTWAFHIKEIEQIVSWKGKYAGTFDLITYDNYIIDLKTTTELHTDWLAYQLGLYAMAKGFTQDFHYCMWLPKGKVGKVIQINVPKQEELEQLVKEYEEHSAAE